MRDWGSFQNPFGFSHKSSKDSDLSSVQTHMTLPIHLTEGRDFR